jgi:hypothetical protein
MGEEIKEGRERLGIAIERKDARGSRMTHKRLGMERFTDPIYDSPSGLSRH